MTPIDALKFIRFNLEQANAFIRGGHREEEWRLVHCLESLHRALSQLTDEVDDIRRAQAKDPPILNPDDVDPDHPLDHLNAEGEREDAIAMQRRALGLKGDGF